MIALALISISLETIAQTVSTFDDLILTEDSYWNGSDNSGGFQSGEAYFHNEYHTEWSYWLEGFAYSNKTDNTNPGYSNLYSAFTGGGYGGSANYAVATGSNVGIKLTGSEAGKLVRGLYMTNTTYAALSMKDGDQFAKKFGGEAGNDPDWFKVTITGYRNGVSTRNNVEVYLADYRFDDNSKDYIVDYWKWVDLTPLGMVDSIAFSMASSDVGEFGMNTPAFFAIDNFNDLRFAPTVDVEGTTAIHKDNANIIAWATSVVVERGPQNISDASSPDAKAGSPSMVLGKPDAGVVSLGDGGSATLTFSTPIVNGDGFDFVVFENGLASEDKAFLELAFVEVSSDGNRFVRFPAVSLTDASTQTPSFGLTDPKNLHNLAGKYVAPYGTPFDLEDLKDSAGLDLNNITHVRVVDVVGSINPLYATYDIYGNAINDPWPTEFDAGGFDLTGVGVINTNASTGINYSYDSGTLTIYPNPVAEGNLLTIKVSDPNMSEYYVQIYDNSGQVVKEAIGYENDMNLSLESMQQGLYIVKIIKENKVITKKLVVK